MQLLCWIYTSGWRRIFQAYYSQSLEILIWLCQWNAVKFARLLVYCADHRCIALAWCIWRLCTYTGIPVENMRRTAVVIVLIIIVSICRRYLYWWIIHKIWHIENLLRWRTKFCAQVLYRCIYSILYSIKSPFYIRPKAAHKHSRQIMLQCSVCHSPCWIGRRWSLTSQKHEIVVERTRLLQLAYSFPCDFYHFVLL